MRQLGAEIMRDQPGYVVGHLKKDGKDIWLNVSSTRDDGYHVAEVFVEPFKPSLLPPGGNDFRLLGHMPGYVAEQPDKKSFAEYAFPTNDGDFKIRGSLTTVTYQPPEKEPQRKVTRMEIIQNYRVALQELGAELLRDDGYGAENLTARFDDHGKLVYVYVTQNQVVAVEEKPFQMTMQPPTADAMKDELDKDGHIALYVNFDFAKATLKPDAAPVIAQVVDLLRRNPALKVSIEGHTDSVGGHDYNMKLSQDRAASVVAAVVTGGIDRSRLQSAGFGPDKPIDTSNTDVGRAKNRRVELVKAQ
jgi:outer membrane protein OmpA-like peptidoglycan-associated protein